MDFHLFGKLRIGTAEQPSFEGCRIEATLFTPGEPSLTSALCDAAGNFTLVFPGLEEIASEKVYILVFSPTGSIIGEMEFVTGDLGKDFIIEVETFDAGSSEEVTLKVNTPESVAVDALFRTDAALRHTITENLKSLRGESEAVAARVENAWKFRPSQLSADELSRRHFVAPGEDPGEVQEKVIMSGVDALRSAKTEHALTLQNTAELKKLIKNNQESGDSLEGVVELGPLFEFIQRRGAGPLRSAELTSTRYRAEADAENILEGVENGDRDMNGKPVARGHALTSAAVETKELVINTVNMQIMSATAPESQLTYAKLPNSADEDKAQQTILQSFELREGPTDVTSYHDFHTLQIAFEHVWTEIFDGQLASLGRDLYSEYVKLKDFSGSSQPDLQVSTIADLKRLIEEIKKLSQFVHEDIPSSLRPEGGGQGINGWVSVKPEDVARAGVGLATGFASLFIEWAFNELIKLGNKPVIIAWKDFPLKLNEGKGNIIERLPEQYAVYPGNVEIVLETDSNSFKKQIVFQQWDSDTQRPIYSAEIQNFGGGHGSELGPSGTIIDRLLLNTLQIASGTLKFVSEDELVPQLLLGRYVLGDLTEVLKDRTRVTFRWKGRV
jgi:hypothetical protein